MKEYIDEMVKLLVARIAALEAEVSKLRVQVAKVEKTASVNETYINSQIGRDDGR